MRKNIIILVCMTVFFGLCGCGKEKAKIDRTSDFDNFIPSYNNHITGWLNEQREATEKEIAGAEVKLQNAGVNEREGIERNLTNLKREQEKWNFRLSLGGYFRFGEISKIPSDLVWEDGMEHEEIGDPRAKKGGTLNRDMPAFPPTIRPFGDNSNNGFRGSLYDEIDMPLVGYHPKSMKLIPGLAKQWAVSADGRTVYFKMNEKARYSDGVSVKAKDFIFGSYIRISDDIVNPYAKQFWRENIAGIVVYDDLTLSVSLPEARIYAPAVAGLMPPSPPHFYDDYGPDFTERHQWKFPPTTGAYEVLEKDIVKGVSVTQTRVKDWWAKNNKYYKYRFNVDRIRHVVVREEPKSFELFRAGELDTFPLTRPEYWYEKSEVDPVFNGYIERYTFYNQYPAIPRGFYLNVSKPLLNERNVRIGIQHAMNWQKVIDVIHRGDYQRLNAFNQGYLLFSDPTIKAYQYSISAARAAFARAGFTQTDRNGILQREDGTRLSIALSYQANPTLERMFSILREEAKACGFDLRLDANEAIVDYKKTMQKQHEITFSAWVITPPTPDFYQFLHSSNARDARGNLKTQTNNIFTWVREDTDLLCEKSRNARTEEELRDASFKLQHIIHDEAIFVPSYNVDFVRIGSWRWLRWPDSDQTKFCVPVVYDPFEAHVHWIDEDMKRETIEAKRKGKKFPEVNRIYDDYKISPKLLNQEPASVGEVPE